MGTTKNRNAARKGRFDENPNYYEKRHTVAVMASINAEQRAKARELAKSQGYSFQGWVGNLIIKAISEADGFDGNTSSQP